MIIQGSMRYSPSGRKRKTNAWRKAKTPDFVAQTKKKFVPVQKLDEIPSMKSTGHCSTEDTSWKVEASKNFTVAPAYNKGAYQVIPKGDIKWIGK
jgi:hypothetical protein